MGDLGSLTIGNAWTNATTTTLNYQVYGNTYGNIFGNPTIPPPRGKTALDWLDERVNEMRVKL